MILDRLIEQLQELKQQHFETEEKIEVYIAEHGFSLGAIQVYLRDMHETDIKYKTSIQDLHLVYPEPHIKKGIIIGVVPEYETKQEFKEDQSQNKEEV
jgi:hypothetical protein